MAKKNAKKLARHKLASTSHTRRTSLSALPDKVLQQIFDHLPLDFTLPLLSHRFLPFHRAQRSRSFQTSLSPVDLHRFSRAVTLNRGLTLPVQRLVIHAFDIKPLWDGTFEPEEEEEFVTVVRAFPALRQLEVQTSSRFVERVVRPSLEFIKLNCTLESFMIDSRTDKSKSPDPFHLSGLRVIDQRLLIETEKLEVAVPESVVQVHRLELASRATQLPLFSVKLYGKDCLHDSVQQLVGTLPLGNLDIVTLSNRELDLASALESITDPSRLTRLSIFAFRVKSQFHFHLHSFVNLTDLSLGQEACYKWSLLHDILATLSLERLHLGPGTHVDVTSVKEYVTPEHPKRISTLKLLILDNIDAAIGRGGVRGSDWVLPTWTLECPRAGVQKLKDTAETVGVKVKGTTFFGLVIKETNEYKKYLGQERQKQEKAQKRRKGLPAIKALEAEGARWLKKEREAEIGSKTLVDEVDKAYLLHREKYAGAWETVEQWEQRKLKEEHRRLKETRAPGDQRNFWLGHEVKTKKRGGEREGLE